MVWRPINKRSQIWFAWLNLFGDIANLKLDIYRVMKIHIRNYYGGARGPLLAPLLVVVYIAIWKFSELFWRHFTLVGVKFDVKIT